MAIWEYNNWQAPTPTTGTEIDHTYLEDIRKRLFVLGDRKAGPTAADAFDDLGLNNFLSATPASCHWTTVMNALRTAYPNGYPTTDTTRNMFYPGQAGDSCNQLVVKYGESFSYNAVAYNATNSTATVAGDHTGSFRVDTPITISGSIANDGIYRVFETPTFDGTNTIVKLYSDGDYSINRTTSAATGTVSSNFGIDYYCLKDIMTWAIMGNGKSAGSLEQIVDQEDLEAESYRPPAGGLYSADSNSYWIRCVNPYKYHHFDRNSHRVYYHIINASGKTFTQSTNEMALSDLILLPYPSYYFLPTQVDPKEIDVPIMYDYEGDFDGVTWQYGNKVEFLKSQISIPDNFGPVRVGEGDYDNTGDTEYATSQQYGPTFQYKSDYTTYTVGYLPYDSDLVSDSDGRDIPDLITKKLGGVLGAYLGAMDYQSFAEHVVSLKYGWMVQVSSGTEYGAQYIDNWLRRYGDTENSDDPIYAYNSTKTYIVGECCTSGGTTYKCVLESTGNTPPNATYWTTTTQTYHTYNEHSSYPSDRSYWSPKYNSQQLDWDRSDSVYWGCNESSFELFLWVLGEYDWYLDTSKPYQSPEYLKARAKDLDDASNNYPESSTSADAWVSTTSYNVGALVRHDGKSYRSLTSSNLNNEPPDATNWLEVSNWNDSKNKATWRRTWKYSLGRVSNTLMRSGSRPAPANPNEWDSTTDYDDEAICYYDGQNYRSLQTPNLNKQPDTETSYWETIATYDGIETSDEYTIIPLGSWYSTTQYQALTPDDFAANNITPASKTGYTITLTGDYSTSIPAGSCISLWAGSTLASGVTYAFVRKSIYDGSTNTVLYLDTDVTSITISKVGYDDNLRQRHDPIQVTDSDQHYELSYLVLKHIRDLLLELDWKVEESYTTMTSESIALGYDTDATDYYYYDSLDAMAKAIYAQYHVELERLLSGDNTNWTAGTYDTIGDDGSYSWGLSGYYGVYGITVARVKLQDYSGGPYYDADRLTIMARMTADNSGSLVDQSDDYFGFDATISSDNLAIFTVEDKEAYSDTNVVFYGHATVTLDTNKEAIIYVKNTDSDYPQYVSPYDGSRTNYLQRFAFNFEFITDTGLVGIKYDVNLDGIWDRDTTGAIFLSTTKTDSMPPRPISPTWYSYPEVVLYGEEDKIFYITAVNTTTDTITCTGTLSPYGEYDYIAAGDTITIAGHGTAVVESIDDSGQSDEMPNFDITITGDITSSSLTSVTIGGSVAYIEGEVRTCEDYELNTPIQYKFRCYDYDMGMFSEVTDSNFISASDNIWTTDRTMRVRLGCTDDVSTKLSTAGFSAWTDVYYSVQSRDSADTPNYSNETFKQLDYTAL